MQFNERCRTWEQLLMQYVCDNEIDSMDTPDLGGGWFGPSFFPQLPQLPWSRHWLRNPPQYRNPGRTSLCRNPVRKFAIAQCRAGSSTRPARDIRPLPRFAEIGIHGNYYCDVVGEARSERSKARVQFKFARLSRRFGEARSFRDTNGSTRKLRRSLMH